MNIERAQQIAQSDELVDVIYYGASYYIDQVDETSGMARIYSRENPDDPMQTVPVIALTEPDSFRV
ncbi:H-type small acid-soluble spore protein [Cohnella pontilimi]|uniref:H-type small acid-soluble spore protein n=1 Tax=Cohnella pontilimi TaxID=2564100 RepID=A0A4U0FAZ6_9BACL|nr:H-type small acid-soluble spore protein [Cohnella pontilimi]TJY41841.1 H-type small acid-soluble spore protein [Cohnella pontilimi]